MADNPLIAEMHRVFNLLWEVWPSKFNSADAARKMNMWAKPLHGIDVSVLMDATQQWISNNRFAPTPAELSAYAWRLHKARNPEAPSSGVTHRSQGAIDEALRLERRTKRFTVRAEYLREQLGEDYSMAAITQIWGLLFQLATTPEGVNMVREARVKRAEIDEAIRLYRQQQRFTQGPIKVRVDGARQAAVIA